MSDIRTIEGDFTGGKGRYALVVGRWNSFVVEHLLEGALDTLRRHGVPVTLREYLGFLDGMAAGLVTYDVDGFYYLARSAMVKDECHIDRFDRAFATAGTDAGLAASIDEALATLEHRLEVRMGIAREAKARQREMAPATEGTAGA